MSTLETANGIAEHEQTVKTEPKKELPDELPSRSPRKSLLQQSPEPRRKSRRSSAASARVRCSCIASARMDVVTITSPCSTTTF